MNKKVFDSFKRTSPPPWAEKAREAATQCRKMEELAYKSFSGTDVAEAPIKGLQADVLGCVALGCDLDELLSWAKATWCDYAAKARAKVAAAAKIKFGPSAGHSVIHHRWVSDEAWDPVERHLRALVRIWEGQEGSEDAHSG